MNIKDIEDKIMYGEMTAEQVFTQIKKIVDESLIDVISESMVHNIDDYDSELNWLCRVVTEVRRKNVGRR